MVRGRSVLAGVPGDQGLLSSVHDSSGDAGAFLRHLKEVSLCGLAWLDDLPLLSKGHSVHLGGPLVDLDGSDHRDLGVLDLRDVDVMLLGRSDLFHIGVPKQRDVDQGFSSDPVLRNINIVDHR